MVSIPMLTCDDIGHIGILRDRGAMNDVELGLFLSLMRDVLDRWYETIGEYGPPVYARYHEHRLLLDDVIEQFDKIQTEDEPKEAFRYRRRLRTSLDRFKALCDELAMPFSSPHYVREFYMNLHRRLIGTYERIVDGENKCQ